MRKLAITYLIGLISGGLLGVLLLPRLVIEERSSETAGPDLDQVERDWGGKLDNLSKSNEELRLKVSALQSELLALRKSEKSEKQKSEQEKQKYISLRLQTYSDIPGLSDEQKRLIGELEWESNRYWKAFREGRVPVDDPDMLKLDEQIGQILTQEQLEVYEVLEDRQKDRVAETAATVFLGRYPISLGLDEEQRDKLYSNLYLAIHADTSAAYMEQLKQSDFDGYTLAEQRLLFAARDVLNPDQLILLYESLRKED